MDCAIPISYFHLARLYETKGELKFAEAAFVQAVTASPANTQFLLDLCRVREKMGDFKGALEAFETLSETLTRAGSKAGAF